MIQSPFEACRRRRRETLGTWMVLCFSLLVPTTIAWGYLAYAETANKWLEAYTPIVYMRTGLNEASVTELKEEMEGWLPVEGVIVRTRQEAYNDLKERLAVDELSSLEISVDSLPVSLLVNPKLPVLGHVELVSRLTALEARLEVESVDVPSSGPLYLLEQFATLGLIFALFALLMLVKATFSLHNYLRLLQEDEKKLWEVLWIFGATESSHRRPTLTRGVALGGFSGFTAAVAAALTLGVWDNAREQVLSSIEIASGWWLAGLPVLSGVVLGVATAFLTTASRREAFPASGNTR
jgi:cell division transport system permease protein